MEATEHDEQWMRRALELAEHAASEGEIPVGAVLVRNGELLGEGWNCPITGSDPTAHAEIRALRAAAERENNYRLPGTTLYVTLEPCIMCAGAIIHARVARLVYAANDPKVGVAGNFAELFPEATFNHHVEISGGLLAEEAGTILRDFFRVRRERQ